MSGDDLVLFRARRAIAAIAFNPPPYATDALLAIADGAAEAAQEIARDPARHPHGLHLIDALLRLESVARAFPPLIEETADAGA
jgi:hypothetical protein